MTPLVTDLKEAWFQGFNVVSPQKIPLCVKLALTCVTCDIPASRKVCGFLSHNSSLACNKCLKKFCVKFAERTDFSGFDRENWPVRSREQHLRSLEEIKKERCKTHIQRAESQHGLRYSVLLALPYFDPIQFTAIDTMHNLFLGTAKHAFTVWIEQNILSRSNLFELEHR